MSKHKHLKFNIYFFIGLSVVITLFFTAVAINSVQNEKVKQQEIYQEKVSGLVESFQTSIENSMMAFEIITGLIEEKLLISSHILTEISLPYSNEVLKDLAHDLNIDEIYYFDQNMTVLYSSTERLIGWQAYIGHPVYEFYQSDANYLVEDIRKDTEGDNYYKFAYIKREDGSFLQLAILADNYYQFIDRFESNRQVNLIYNPDTMLNVKYISTSNVIRSSTNTFEVGKQLTPNVDTLDLVRDDVLIRTGTYQGQEAVYTYTKVYKGNVYFGTLVVIFNQKDMNASIDEQVFSIIRQYVVVMLIIAILVYYAYTRNKKSIRLALFDPLTGIPNYLYLLSELNQVKFSKGKKKKGLIYINVVDFRHVTMTHGYTFGNEVIKEIGARLRDNLEKNDLLFRLQAERFCVIIDEYESNNQLELIANNLFTVFSRGFGPQEKVILSAKMSMVSQIESYESNDQIIQDAIIALELIKDNNRSIGFFKNDMELLVQRQDLIIKTLRDVIQEIDKTSFQLYYQAEYDVIEQRIFGFEALARLSVEGIGNVSPMEFIPIAENSLLIYDLGKVIIKDSCMFLKSLESDQIKVSINISGIQLMREEFVEDFLGILESTETNRNQIIVEVTESVFLDNFELINVKLKELRDAGIEIALDDFGTGYSSLSRLKELNIDYVKIDKYFIDRILSTEIDRLLTTDIVSIIHKMGYKAVAEGVETEEQKAYLESVGCDLIQGYLICKPLKKSETYRFF